MGRALIDIIINSLPIDLLKLIYPLQEPQRVRDADKPVEVLCLGLGRTGTTSLQLALEQLGYHDPFHGWRIAADLSMTASFVRLGQAQYRSPHGVGNISAKQFDATFGNSRAILDSPAVIFGVELLRAYPNAKVILNRRRDIDAWYTSHLHTMQTLFATWTMWWQSFFDSQLFWLRQCHNYTDSPWDLDFEHKGKQGYAQHYLKMENECRLQGREYLDWTVEDGWEPLCKFLGKPVPVSEFPNENNVGKFQERAFTAMSGAINRAKRNMMIVAGTAVGALFVAVCSVGLHPGF